MCSSWNLPSLIESGIGEDVVSVLIEQKVLNERVIRAMKEEHLKRLLQCDGICQSVVMLYSGRGGRQGTRTLHACVMRYLVS